jgi:hypothetical protein
MKGDVLRSSQGRRGISQWHFCFTDPRCRRKPAFFLTTHDEIAEGRRVERLAWIRAEERQEILERLRATLSLSGGAAAWEGRVYHGVIVGDARFAGL